jgi:hypothetical protein
MGIEVEDPRCPSSPGSTKTEKSSSHRWSSEGDEEKERGDRRETVPARQDNDELVVAQSARVQAILAKASSAPGNKRKDYVNRDINAAINIM